MADPTFGGFEYRGRSFRFQVATCSLDQSGYLHVEATGICECARVPVQRQSFGAHAVVKHMHYGTFCECSLVFVAWPSKQRMAAM